MVLTDGNEFVRCVEHPSPHALALGERGIWISPPWRLSHISGDSHDAFLVHGLSLTRAEWSIICTRVLLADTT
jgi:hypothetical protein